MAYSLYAHREGGFKSNSSMIVLASTLYVCQEARVGCGKPIAWTASLAVTTQDNTTL